MRLLAICLLPLSLVISLGSPRTVCAQALSELPRAEYYVARELFRVGRTAEASDGFKAALNRARRIGDQRWIDSIPPLVMLGECYYQQGNLALAIEHYDNALMLALANPAWTEQIEIQPEQLPDLEISSKSITWFTKSRPTRSVAVPNGIQISIDPTQAQVGPQGGVVAPVSLITRLDATEVLRTMGISLMRRWQILGPLARYSPLREPLDAYLARMPSQPVPWMLSSWNVLRGLHNLSSPSAQDGLQLLRSGTLIGDQLDYYLSSLAMLAIGQLEADEGNYQAAIVSLQDASLLAAQFDQLDTLSEATQLLSACAAASQRVDLIDPLQRLGGWANQKSGSVQVAALLGAAELSAYGGDLAQADKTLKQCSVVLRGREIGLPRAQAQLLYLNALVAFAQNRGPLALGQLDSSLKLMRGSVQSGAVVEEIFQAQLTLDFLAGSVLTSSDAENILLEALAEPSAKDWELYPLKTIARITTSSLPAFEKLLEQAVAKSGDPAMILDRMDRLQRQRFYEALPLGGRLFAWRNALATDPQRMSPEMRQILETSLRQFPALKTTPERIAFLVQQLRLQPPPMDERKLSSNSKRAFAELEELSTSLENLLAFQSLRRQGLTRFAPPPADIQRTQDLIHETDLVIGFVTTSQAIYGVAINKTSVNFWHVSELETIDTRLQNLLIEIGLVRQTDVKLPSQVTAIDAVWRTHAEKLFATLFPAEIRDIVDQAERLIVVPNQRLWYVPFEMLPTRVQANSPVWISKHPITYLPTLGSISLVLGTAPTVTQTVGIVGNFFALDRTSNETQAKTLLQAIPNSQALPLSQKLTIPSTTWLRICTDQVWVASQVDVSAGWDANILSLPVPRQSSLVSWLQAPRVSPARVILPGMQTGLIRGHLREGNELFLPACGLLYSGTRAACLSRWPVGGKSTSTFMQRYLEELQDTRPSDAMRRAIVAQWSEQFLIADEPALLPAGKEDAALTGGTHPILWGGYMAVGDYRAP